MGGAFDLLAARRNVIYTLRNDEVFRTSASGIGRVFIRLSDGRDEDLLRWDLSADAARIGAATNRGVTIYDLETGEELALAPQAAPADRVVFSFDADIFGAVRASGGSAAQPDAAWVFGIEDPFPRVIEGPFAPVERDTADMAPLALSPDGTAALVIRPDGSVERWSVEGTAELEAEVGNVWRARGVVWSRPSRAAIVSQDEVLFVDPTSGEELGRYRRER